MEAKGTNSPLPASKSFSLSKLTIKLFIIIVGSPILVINFAKTLAFSSSIHFLCVRKYPSAIIITMLNTLPKASKKAIELPL
ncbi:hypothetical protein SDC9_147478 [bioreactor metagenome]|uniref:Transmembrane protein n=1 Tax=bioreactor metagenome TaxID=1076179 RepID=A0A645EHQ2_9ZZZZ